MDCSCEIYSTIWSNDISSKMRTVTTHPSDHVSTMEGPIDFFHESSNEHTVQKLEMKGPGKERTAKTSKRAVDCWWGPVFGSLEASIPKTRNNNISTFSLSLIFALIYENKSPWQPLWVNVPFRREENVATSRTKGMKMLRGSQDTLRQS